MSPSHLCLWAVVTPLHLEPAVCEETQRCPKKGPGLASARQRARAWAGGQTGSLVVQKLLAQKVATTAVVRSETSEAPGVGGLGGREGCGGGGEGVWGGGGGLESVSDCG